MEGMAKYLAAVERADPIMYVGRVTKVLGLLLESRGPQAVIVEVCQILVPRLGKAAYAEVVGLREDSVQLMAYEGLEGIEVGCQVIATGELLQVPVSDRLLGRVLDCMGRPADGKGDIASETLYPAVSRPPDALTRKRITRRVVTGVRSIDGLTPLGRGQRIGIFAGSGVGKSTLLNRMAGRHALARVSKTPGRTRGLVLFDLGLRWTNRDAGPARLRIVDLPGYGYAQVPRAERQAWQLLVEGYVKRRETLKLVLVLVDARRTLAAEELELMEWLQGMHVPCQLVITKADKLGAAERGVLRERARKEGRAGAAVSLVSGLTGEGLDALWTRIGRALGQAKDDPTAGAG